MDIGLLHLEKPVMNASGTLSKENLQEVKDLYGALVTKTVTLEPRTGNPPPRVMEVTGGMINSIGLQNPGIEKFLEEELDEWDVGLPVIVSVAGEKLGDEEKLCKILAKESRVEAVELNLSCPNLGTGATLCDVPEALDVVIRICRKVMKSKPLIAKLAFCRVKGNAWIAEGAGADALTLINTIPALSWPYGASEPFLGGLSGPAIKPIALRAVYEVSRVVDIPVIGCGGAGSAKDIEEFMWAGASGVQIGSGSFVREPKEIVGKTG